MTSTAGLQSAGVSTNVLNAIAHELRQPLGTIDSIAYYLSLVLPRGDEKIQEQVSRLQQLVQQANWILTSGLQLTDESPLSPATVDLGELVTDVVSARGAGGDPAVHLELAGDLPLVQLDPGRGRTLVENLLTLFSHLAGGAQPILLRTSSPRREGVSLEIETPAPGFRSESQLGCGCALSLESARRTTAAHGGTLNLNVDPVGGIRLRVVLP